MSPAAAAAVRRLGRLIDDEIELREEARRVELNPRRTDEAARLFRLADRVRSQRVELQDRWLPR